jgi:PAT family beta-lactamase induction signal transducer AmpG
MWQLRSLANTKTSMPGARRLVPVWMMGMANGSIGLYAGFITISLPQLLAKQHLPEFQIASTTTMVISPFFWIFLLSPILDVRFSRRRYATALALIAAFALGIGLLNLDRIAIVRTALITGTAAIVLSSGALGGWLSSVLPKEKETQLSVWFNVSFISGAGVMAIISGELMLHHAPQAVAAALLAILVMLPAAIFLLIPAPGPDRRLAGESFGRFLKDIYGLLRQREVLVAVAMFVTPAGAFALTNILSGLGDDFHASVRWVSLVGGAGVAVAGVVGSLLCPMLGRFLALRPLYLVIGIGGGIFTVLMLPLAHSAPIFAVTLIGENIFQSLANTCAFAIQFETIGRNNPIAATTFCVMNAAACLPVAYMTAIDGAVYSADGLTGMYVTDGGSAIAACILLAVMLIILQRGRHGRRLESHPRQPGAPQN